MEQQQEVQLDEGISLVDIFRLLLSHIKMLILAVLIGCVLGSSFAVFKTYGVYHYGTSVTFYVNPKKADVVGDSTNINGTYSAPIMDSMIKLLNDEIFAEALMLNNEKVPEKDVWTTAEEEATYKLNEKIDKANAELTVLKEKEEEIEVKTEEKSDASLELTKANKELSKAKKAYDTVNKELEDEWYAHYIKYSSKDGDTTQSIFSPSFNESIYKNLENDPAHSGKLSDTLKEKYHDWTIARDEKNSKEELQILAEQTVDDLTDTITTLEKALENVQENTNEAVSAALTEWRKTAKYGKTLPKYKNAVSFQYLTDSTKDLADSQYVSRNQIFVNISLYSDKDAELAFANDLLERVKVVVPAFVETNMTKINGYSGTSCIRTTRLDEIQHTNPNYMLTSIIKYGLLAGVAALVIACIAIILLDKSDKRLRDTEVIVKKFNLPVLGIIPSLEEIEQSQKKKSDKSSTEVQ